MADPLLLALRAAHYALLLGLFGLTAFRVMGLRQLPVSARVSRTVQAEALAAPLLTVALFVAGVAAMMGQPLGAADWATVEAMVLTTDMGWAFAARTALLLAAIPALLAKDGTATGRAIAAGLYAAALMTLPWSGHAAAQGGAFGTLHRLNDALHLLAAGYWLGAIGWFAALARRAGPSTRAASDGVPPPLLLAAMHRFRPVGIALVAVVALTGAVNAQLTFGIGQTAQVLTTPYGQLLALKITLVALMLAAAARHSRLARTSAAQAHSEEAAAALAAARGSLLAELMFAAAVIIAVAVLGMLSPMPEPI